MCFMGGGLQRQSSVHSRGRKKGCVKKWDGDKGTGTSGRVCGDLGLGDAR